MVISGLGKGFLVLLMLGVAGNLVQASPLKLPFQICYENVPQPPYYYGEGTTIPDQNPGLYVEISQMLGQRLSLEISHLRAPWKRCLALMQNNSVDAVYGASYKKERLVFGLYPMVQGQLDEGRRIATKSYSLYKNKDAMISWDGDKLTNAYDTIGAPLGYSIISFLENRGADVKTRWSTELGLSLVSLGRLSSFAAQDPAADALIQEEPERYVNVVKITPSLQTKAYYMMISHGFYKRDSALGEAIWTEIARIRETELPALFKKYSKMQ